MNPSATNMDIRGMRSMQTGSDPKRRTYIVVGVLLGALVVIIGAIYIHQRNMERKAEIVEANKQMVINELIESSKSIKISPEKRAKIIEEMTK